MLPYADNQMALPPGGQIPATSLDRAAEAYKENAVKASVDSAEPAAGVNTAATSRPTSVIPKDTVEINLSLSHEERDVFYEVYNLKRDPATLSPAEQDTLQAASERISDYIEDTIARNTENREKVEKAVVEWYNRLTNGEPPGPLDLVNLLRAAAMGQLDF